MRYDLVTVSINPVLRLPVLAAVFQIMGRGLRKAKDLVEDVTKSTRKQSPLCFLRRWRTRAKPCLKPDSIRLPLDLGVGTCLTVILGLDRPMVKYVAESSFDRHQPSTSELR